MLSFSFWTLLGLSFASQFYLPSAKAGLEVMTFRVSGAGWAARGAAAARARAARANTVAGLTSSMAMSPPVAGGVAALGRLSPPAQDELVVSRLADREFVFADLVEAVAAVEALVAEVVIHTAHRLVLGVAHGKVVGDERVRPRRCGDILQNLRRCRFKSAGRDDIANPNAVKVVSDFNGRSLYFSRSTIPFDRDRSQPGYFKHLGIYAYRKRALDLFVSLPESSLERAERLEQLRFLENGISIAVAESSEDTIGVDTAEDLRRVEEFFARTAATLPGERGSRGGAAIPRR